MFGAHAIYIISVYSLFVALIAWHLITPLVQLSALKRSLERRLSSRQRDAGSALGAPLGAPTFQSAESR